MYYIIENIYKKKRLDMSEISKKTCVYYMRRVIVKNIHVYVAVLFLGILVCVYYKGNYRAYYNSVNNTTYVYKESGDRVAQNEQENETAVVKELKAGDYMLYLFKGLEPIDKNVSGDKKMELPAIYLSIVIMCALIVGLNVGDKDDYVVMCFSKSREMWINGKLAGMYISVIIVIMELLVTTVFAAGGKTGFASYNSAYLIRYDYNRLDSLTAVILVVLSMIITLMMMVTLQFMLSLIAGQIAGYVCIIALSVMAIFVNSGFIPGNGLMLIRYNCFLNEGYSVIFICIYAIIISVISYVISRIYMKRKDII